MVIISNSSAGGSGGGSNSSLFASFSDYTLPGVLRFLQVEWERADRERVEWQIERTEMKARIARLEGEKVAADMTLDTYNRRIKMLEQALEEERRKSSGCESPPEKSKSDEGSPSAETFLNQPIDLELEIDARDRSRGMIEKCLQEVSYLLSSQEIDSRNISIAAGIDTSKFADLTHRQSLKLIQGRQPQPQTSSSSNSASPYPHSVSFEPTAASSVAIQTSTANSNTEVVNELPDSNNNNGHDCAEDTSKWILHNNFLYGSGNLVGPADMVLYAGTGNLSRDKYIAAGKDGYIVVYTPAPKGLDVDYYYLKHRGHKAEIRRLLIAQDRTLYTAGDDNIVRRFRFINRSDSQLELDFVKWFTGHTGTISDIAIGQDPQQGRQVVSGENGYDSNNNSNNINNSIMGGADVLASASVDGSVRIWDCSAGETNCQIAKIKRRKLFTKNVSGLYTTDGLMIPSAVCFLPPMAYQYFNHQSTENNNNNNNSNRLLLLVAWKDCKIDLFDAKTEKLIKTFDYENVKDSCIDTTSILSYITRLRVSHSGEKVFASTSDGGVFVYNCQDGKLLCRVDAHGSNCSILGLGVDPITDSSQFVTLGDDGCMRIWKINDDCDDDDDEKKKKKKKQDLYIIQDELIPPTPNVLGGGYSKMLNADIKWYRNDIKGIDYILAGLGTPFGHMVLFSRGV